MPPAVERVCRVLTAVRASGVSDEDALVIADALELLLAVVPSYAPLGPNDQGDSPMGEVGVPAALAALDEAADAATTVRELTRYTTVALLLQRVPIPRLDQ